jgi:pyruvate kinase
LKNKKIIATLGPSSLKKSVVMKMDTLGVDIFRINLSHVKIDEFEKTIKLVQTWTKKPVCPDSEGAQLRTGFIKDNSQYLSMGSKIIIGESVDIKNILNIPINMSNPKDLLKPGDILRIDFNSVIVQIIEFNNNGIFARVIKEGIIGSNKGIGVDRKIEFPTFTKKDLLAFDISKRLELDTFFLSFCSTGEDVKNLRKLFNYPIKIISKIETNKALKNLSSICKESDGILIDRGDLSRDVPLTKIAFAQKYILDTALNLDVSTYVATNLVESMINNSEPTRAEINDIVHTLKSGANGLVLAAETAIGKFPNECVRVVSNLIKEVEQHPSKIEIKYLLNPISENIIKPHGGKLINQLIDNDKLNTDLPIIEVNQKIESDIIQIANGTYSPLDRFMDHDELDLVSNNNKLRNDIDWPMPILFQLDDKQKRIAVNNDKIYLKSSNSGEILGFIQVDKLEELKDINKTSKDWFGTNNVRHPGVKEFLNSGNWILSGKPFLVKSKKQSKIVNHELTPLQSRELFSLYGWRNIIGYHTRNIPHRGHEYIQKKALEITNADGIFISPVIGIKKKGDFTADAIINSFEILLKEGFYKPYEALIGSFNTYSRYSGPKEAAFTAICRKNYGCNYFIVGRDHTGVGNFYDNKDSQKIFADLDLGMDILKFDQASYCRKRKKITENFKDEKYLNSKIEISGSMLRDLIVKGAKIPDYILNPLVANQIVHLFQTNKEKVFE